MLFNSRPYPEVEVQVNAAERGLLRLLDRY